MLTSRRHISFYIVLMTEILESMMELLRLTDSHGRAFDLSRGDYAQYSPAG